MTRDYLVELLKAYWFAPPVALWRAVELRAASGPCTGVGHPLLDLGCGDGLIGEILFPNQSSVDVGLDPWRDQLSRAAASSTYRHIDQAEGHALPYREASFNTVFSNSVLEHIADVEPVLQEVGRVLKPGGRLIFTVPSHAFRQMLHGYAIRIEASDPNGAEAYAASVDERLEHHHYYTPDEWAAILSRADMALVEASYYVPETAERFWDRMNHRYGIGQRRSLWSILASPRLRTLGYQALLRRLIVKRLSRRWRSYYEMDVPLDQEGGGLLVVAQR